MTHLINARWSPDIKRCLPQLHSDVAAHYMIYIPDSKAGNCLRKIKESFRWGKTAPRNIVETHTSEFYVVGKYHSKMIWNQMQSQQRPGTGLIAFRFKCPRYTIECNGFLFCFHEFLGERLRFFSPLYWDDRQRAAVSFIRLLCVCVCVW